MNEGRENYKSHLVAINRIADALETTKLQEQTDDDKRAFRETVTIALLVAAVIFSFAADVIFYLSLKDSHANSKEQLSKMEEASGLVRDSNGINKQSMEASTRAWVGTSNASIIGGGIQAAKPVVIDVAVNNTGREPATSFSYDPDPTTITGAETTMFEMDMKDFVSNCFAESAKPEAQVLYPSVGFGANGFDFQTTFTGERITSDVISGNTILVVRGCMTYDTFGQTRHSSFCYFYKNGVSKPDRLNICNGGSRAD